MDTSMTHHSPISSPETTSDDDIITTSDDYNYNPLLTFTENSSATYRTSQNPCLDFFFHVVPDTSPDTITRHLTLAWAHNPLTTLKLICNLRGVRGSGKSDRQGFYTSAIWVHEHHPKTLACNIPVLVEFGYFKDLVEILYRLIEGADVRSVAKEEWVEKKGRKGKGMG